MVTQDTLDFWQSQYSALFRNTSDGVIVTDSSGLLSRINPAAASMLQCVPEDCIGKKPGSVFRDTPALLELLVSGETSVRKVSLPGKRIALGYGDPQGETGRLVLLQDITEREALDSRREQLISAISHDLRNPISAIYGFNELVRMYGPLTVDQDRFVTRIAQTSQKLQNLAPTLVDLAWVESGMPMDNVPVDLDKVIRAAVGALETSAKQKRMSIAVSTQSPMPVVMGDPLRLKQVVHHLLHNAILYSEPEQTVGIHAFAQGGQVQCSVADRGFGIATSELDRIFDRLYRSSDEAVRDLPGGGIGLTLARIIIKRHGGTIEATSVYRRGSTFIFTLPLAV